MVYTIIVIIIRRVVRVMFAKQARESSSVKTRIVPIATNRQWRRRRRHSADVYRPCTPFSPHTINCSIVQYRLRRYRPRTAHSVADERPVYVLILSIFQIIIRFPRHPTQLNLSLTQPESTRVDGICSPTSPFFDSLIKLLFLLQLFTKISRCF